MGKKLNALAMVGLMTVAGLNAHANGGEDDSANDMYFIGSESFFINVDEGDDLVVRNKYSSGFAGHEPTKSIPLTKQVKGYTVHCVSQAGVALSDYMYNFELDRVKYATFNFCDEKIVDTILVKAKEISKPNFVEGLKLIKLTHSNKDNIAYLVLVDEKGKAIYTNNGVHINASVKGHANFNPKNKDKVKGLGTLIANSKSNKYCFENNQANAIHPFYEAYGSIYTPFISKSKDMVKESGQCGTLIKDGTAKYQLVPTMSYVDEEYKYGFKHATVTP